MIRTNLTLTSEGAEIELPMEVTVETLVDSLEEIAQQIFDLMDRPQKEEWDKEDYDCEDIEEGRVLEIPIDWPEDLEERTVQQIRVRADDLNLELKDIKSLIIGVDEIAADFDDEEDDEE